MTKRQIAFLAVSVAMMVTLLAGAVFGQATQKNNIYRYLSIFSEVFELVRTNYVEPVGSDVLMDGAFSGVTDAVDEFSYYVPPAQMAAYKSFSDIEDNGIGLVVTKRFGYAYVVSSVPGSPADRAKVEKGDFIEKIDGQQTQSMAVWQVRNALRTGKPLKLQVLRGGEARREEVTIQPAEFHPLQVASELVSGVTWVRIPYFEKGTAAQFRSVLENARRSGTRKLIVDVRGNAAGSVDEAILAADELLTGGVITSVAGRKVEPKRWAADKETSFDGDVLVLTDNSTASGAEIFAAAIRGNGRGKVVGISSYGKAILQKFVTLPSGGGVQLTVGHYTDPELKPIKERGVRPDVLVDLSAQVLLRDEKSKETRREDDLILNRALEIFGVTTTAPAEKKAA